MDQRPQILTFLAAFMAILALIFPLQLWALYERFLTFEDLSMVSLALIHYALLLMTWSCSYTLFQASRQALWIVPTTTLFTGGYYFYFYQQGLFPHLETNIGIFSIFLAVNLFITDVKVRHLLTHPHLRWWRTPQRTPIRVSIYVSPSCSEGFFAQTYDLSERGAFIPHRSPDWPCGPAHHQSSALVPGSEVSIRLTLGSFRTVRFSARVVRLSHERQGQYPAGFALYFNGAKRQDRHHIHCFLAHALEALNDSKVAS